MKAEPGKVLDINETQAGKEFNDFVKLIGLEKKMGTAISLSSIASPKRIEVLVATINESPAGKINFCQKYILANMQQYVSQINAVSADLVEMVHNFSGFTGTPWNLHTYHDKIHAEKSAGVDGKTWALLLGRDIKIHSFDFDAEKPIESLIDQVGVVGNYQAVIDTGAYLRGTNNRDFVDKCFETATKKGIEMEGGIYFDEAGKIVKKRGLDEKPMSIETAADTDKMKTITLYDQAHTVGADIKQGKKAKAVVTIGENTFVRDLFQAVWRLRQLHQGQTVAFAVSNALKGRILGGADRELTTEDILKFCLANEAGREGDDNFRAEREKINGFTRRAVMPKIAELIDSGISDEQVLSLATRLGGESADLFIKKRPGEEAYDQYGKMTHLTAPDEIFRSLKENAKQKCERAAKAVEDINPSAQKYFVSKGQEVQERANPPKDWCPKETASTASAGGEVEQEAQAEVEQELELMIETETEQQVQVEVESIIPKIETGEAGHGEVIPLQLQSLKDLVGTGKAQDLMWPHGKQVGDVVIGDEMKPIKGIVRQLSNGTPFFDHNIFLTAVFERNLPVEDVGGVPPQAIFYSNRKPVKNILIVKNEDIWVLVIPTIHEAHLACRDFVKETKNQAIEVAISPSGPKTIYKSGDDRSEALPFGTDEDRRKFYELYVQAKLFNGEIEFNTPEEQEALKTWLKAKGVAEFKAYFEQNILAAKPRRFADAYQTSSLFKIFQSLLEEASLQAAP